jgi:hypothetical protein
MSPLNPNRPCSFSWVSWLRQRRGKQDQDDADKDKRKRFHESSNKRRAVARLSKPCAFGILRRVEVDPVAFCDL